MAARNWNKSQREAQANAIRRWKPWLSATGPRTAIGKNVASRNSLKHGCSTRWIFELRCMERRAKLLQARSLAIADDVEILRLKVSKMVAETAFKRRRANEMVKAYHFSALQTAKARTNLFGWINAGQGNSTCQSRGILKC